MFQKDGPVTVVLGEVAFAEPKFPGADQNAFDVCVQCTHAEDPAQVDWWRGEWSNNYGKGNFASMTQAEITMKTLRNIGFEGDDLTTLADQITGKRVPAMIKASEKDGKTYYNIQYIGASGGGNAPTADKVLSKDAMKARMAALNGGTRTAGQPPAGAAPNPFGGSATTQPAASPDAKSGAEAGASKPNRKSPF